MGFAAMWATVARVAHRAMVDADAFFTVSTLTLLTVTFWCLVVCIVLAIALGIVTHVRLRRSRRAAGGSETADGGVLEASRFGRPALFAAIGIAGLLGLTPVLSVVAGRWVATVVGVACMTLDLLCVTVLWYLIRLNADVLERGRLAGFDALATYLMLTAGSWFALWTGWWIAVFMAAANYKPPA